MEFSSSLIITSKESGRKIHIPKDESDAKLIKKLTKYRCRIQDLGLGVSTGPVVPFRATEALCRQKKAGAVPLLWMQHVQRESISWPLGSVFNKEEYIDSKLAHKSLLPNKNYILIRRVSSIDDKHRLTCAFFSRNKWKQNLIGIENHLNYIYGLDSELEEIFAQKLVRYLNSSVVDRYFRITNGNTQISATELRELPVPDCLRPTSMSNGTSKSCRS